MEAFFNDFVLWYNESPIECAIVMTLVGVVGVAIGIALFRWAFKKR